MLVRVPIAAVFRVSMKADYPTSSGISADIGIVKWIADWMTK